MLLKLVCCSESSYKIGHGIFVLDPCHDFAWCLDACVRDKHLDSQQTNKLKILLDTGKKSSTKVRFDFCHGLCFFVPLEKDTMKMLYIRKVHEKWNIFCFYNPL